MAGDQHKREPARRTVTQVPATGTEALNGPPRAAIEPVKVADDARPNQRAYLTPDGIARVTDMVGIVLGARAKTIVKRVLEDLPRSKEYAAKEKAEERIRIAEAVRPIIEAALSQQDTGSEEARKSMLSLVLELLEEVRAVQDLSFENLESGRAAHEELRGQFDELRDMVVNAIEGPNTRVDLTTGLKLGRFTLVRPLGKGGFALLWRAETISSFTVTVKVLHTHHVDDATLDRFRRGARALASLKHPRIPKIVERNGYSKRYYFYAYVYVPGHNLTSQLPALTLEAGLHVIHDVGCALAHAHSKGLLHRDVNPKNIIVNKERGHLIDFDLVRGPRNTSETQLGSSLGKVVYSAPEAIEDASSMDQRSDVFSLGMTTLAVLLRKRPPATSKRRANVLHPLKCSDDLKALIEKATAEDPEDRHDTIAAFLAALEGIPECVALEWDERFASENRLRNVVAEFGATDPRDEADENINHNAGPVPAPPFVSRVRISRIGPVRDLNIRFEQATVILGLNASGKTTICEAISSLTSLRLPRSLRTALRVDQQPNVYEIETFDGRHRVFRVELLPERTRFLIDGEPTSIFRLPWRIVWPRRPDSVLAAGLEGHAGRVGCSVDELYELVEHGEPSLHAKPFTIESEELFVRLSADAPLLPSSALSGSELSTVDFELSIRLANATSKTQPTVLILENELLSNVDEQTLNRALAELARPDTRFQSILTSSRIDAFTAARGYCVQRLRSRWLPARANADADRLLHEGQWFGHQRYCLLRRLGQGDVADVWLADDIERGPQVVLKFLHSRSSEDSRCRERLKRGVRVQATLEHASIVRVVEPISEERGRHFYVLDFIDAGDLRNAIPAGLAPERWRAIILQIGAAVVHAHEQGVLHRGIKPSNILLDASGNAYLSDFDLASSDMGASRSQVSLETSLFTAPELLSAATQASERTDVYSLGVTAVHCALGNPLITELLHGRDKLLRKLTCVEPVREVLARAIAIEPSARFQTMIEFLNALRAATMNFDRPSDWAEPAIAPESVLTATSFDTGRDESGTWVRILVGHVALKMRWIPEGECWVGAPPSEEGRHDSEPPRRRVTIRNGFWLAEVPCTVPLWNAIMHRVAPADPPEQPVTGEPWSAVSSFVQRLNERVPGLDARVATEVEWEYACRAGTEGPRYGPLSAIGWNGSYNGDAPPTVRQRLPNAWGLHDMLGLILEFCADAYNAEEDAEGPRALRGASWKFKPRDVRAAGRRRFKEQFASSDKVGFRLAWDGHHGIRLLFQHPDPTPWGLLATQAKTTRAVDAALDSLPEDEFLGLLRRVDAWKAGNDLAATGALEASVAAFARRIVNGRASQATGETETLIQRMVGEQLKRLVTIGHVRRPRTRHNIDEWFLTGWALSLFVHVPSSHTDNKFPWELPGWATNLSLAALPRTHFPRSNIELREGANVWVRRLAPLTRNLIARLEPGHVPETVPSGLRVDR